VCGFGGGYLKFYFLHPQANGLGGLGREKLGGGSLLGLQGLSCRLAVAGGPLAAYCNRITTNINPIISLMYYFLGSLSYLATLVQTTVLLGNILQYMRENVSIYF
jgi:hypothetical protein